MLGCGHSAVCKWRKAFEEGGTKGVQAVPHPGGKSRLSEEDLVKLAEYLKQGPTAAGFETELWTCRRVAYLIRLRFGIEYHHCHVWKILRKLGWTCQKPERCAREQNEDAVLEWRDTRWAEIKKSRIV
jgi:transposase